MFIASFKLHIIRHEEFQSEAFVSAPERGNVDGSRCVSVGRGGKWPESIGVEREPTHGLKVIF